jgi:hypothetical protein
MDYQPYLGWGLNTFEDVMDAFTKFKDGGWWIRKIDYKDAFNREITEGPYKEKDAKSKAESWNKFFKFKNKEITTAKAYSFKDLICNSKGDYLRLKSHLYEEYIWKPPLGAELMCILRDNMKILMVDINSISKRKNIELEKFKLYVLDNGVNLIEVDSRSNILDRESTFNYNIFYKDKDYMAKEQVKFLKLLVENFKESPEELWWLYDAALKNPHCRGLEPVIIPSYIKNFNRDIRPYTLDFFKKIKGDKINHFIDLLRCSKRDISFQKGKETLGYKFPFLYDSRDFLVKNFIVSYLDKTLDIEIKQGIYGVKLNAPKGRIASLTFELPFEKEKLDDVFNFKLVNLMLFICKVLEINEVMLKDNLKDYCKCEEFNNAPIYLNIIRFLAGRNSIYDEIGFTEQNYSKREEIIDKFRWKKVGSFFEGEDVLYDTTIGDLARDYLDGMCEFSYVCDLLNSISVKIFDTLKNCCFEYFIDLRKIKLINLRETLD